MTDLTITTWIVVALLAVTIAAIGVAAYLAHVAHTARADAAAYLAAAHATLAGVEPSQERPVTAIRWKAANPDTFLGCDPHSGLTIATIARHHRWPGWSLTTRHATTHGLNLPDAQTLARSTAH